MQLAHHFQGQTVKGQGYRRAGAYRVGRTRRPNCLLSRRSRHLRKSAPYINPLTYLLTYLFTYLHGLFKEPIIGPLKSTMAEIHRLENRHDVIFFCRGWSDLDKISHTGTE